MKKISIVLLALIAMSANAINLPARNTGAGVRDVLLEWNIPTTRQDGSPLALTDLAGYEIAILCGTDNDILLPIDGGNTSRYSIPNLPIGTCEFAISATDTDGLQSDWSDVVTATIKAGVGPKKIVLIRG